MNILMCSYQKVCPSYFLLLLLLVFTFSFLYRKLNIYSPQINTGPTNNNNADKNNPKIEDFTRVPDVYAIGDCATAIHRPLPATAQVGNQKVTFVTQIIIIVP